ncbi:unnamed protein product, partial [Medioppia subpectinata]
MTSLAATIAADIKCQQPLVSQLKTGSMSADHMAKTSVNCTSIATKPQDKSCGQQMKTINNRVATTAAAVVVNDSANDTITGPTFKANGNTNGPKTSGHQLLMRPPREPIVIKEFNELIQCSICEGYLIDATTVIECLHSFCKTCIISHLDSNTPKSRFCPRCDQQIHKTKPKLNIRSDPTLQDIVYKLVPGLYKNEMTRRKEFYSHESQSAVGLSNEEKGEMSGERLIFTPEDDISLSIEYFPQYISHSLQPFSMNLSNGALNCVKGLDIVASNGSADTAANKATGSGCGSGDAATAGTTAAADDDDSQRRYLQCKGGMRVVHLKKWLRKKYDLNDHIDVEILYKHDPLIDDYTMIDLAYIYSWRR